MSETNDSRADRLGNLIREARLRHRYTIEQCGQILNISSEDYQRMESGESIPSLPELEVLAMNFGVSMDYFWANVELGMDTLPDFKDYIGLRHVMVGTTIRQYRAERHITAQELADQNNLSVEQIESYESGQKIPYFDLEKLLISLERNIHDLIDSESGPLAQHARELLFKKRFKELSPEIKRFISNPLNNQYIETAMRLSELDADTLRKIAEGLLEITY